MEQIPWLRFFIFIIISIYYTLNNVDAQEDDLDYLRKNIPGEPGKDYPINNPSILCKLNPRQCGGQSQSGNGGKKGNGNGRNGGNGRKIGDNGMSKGNGGSNAGSKMGGSKMGGQMNRNNKPSGNKNNGNSRGNNGNGGCNGKSGGGDSTDELDALRKNIPGEPGKDYPIHGQSILCKLNPRQCGGRK